MVKSTKAKTSGSASSSRGEPKPKTAADMRLRIKHTQDSIKYNEAHGRDHAEALKKAKVQLDATKKNLKKLGGKRAN